MGRSADSPWDDMVARNPDGPEARHDRYDRLGRYVPTGWSAERADLHADEARQDRATGAYDEAPF
jgi:hypothetical protein